MKLELKIVLAISFLVLVSAASYWILGEMGFTWNRIYIVAGLFAVNGVLLCIFSPQEDK